MKKIGFLCLMLLLCIGFPGSKTKTEAASKTKLQTSESTIFINEKYTIPLTGKLKKATYIFTSNKTKIAKVNSKGVITGINSGSASIKIRYKYKGDFYSVGTFKVTIHKSSLKTDYKAMDMLTGDTLNPNDYLSGINPNASYIITSSVSAVAKGGSDGVITAKKAGRTAISIHEVYNNRSRKVGSIALAVEGASIKMEEIKMAYNSTMQLSDLLDDMETSNSYYLSTDNTSLMDTSSRRQIKSAARGKETQVCTVTVDEEIYPDKKRHTIGSFKVNVTNDTFISFIHKDILIGFGEQITVNNAGIVIQNKLAGAQYKLIPKDPGILKAEEIKNRSTNLEAVAYGITSVSIEEIKGSNTRLLEDTVDVTVSQAYILKELADNGYELSVDGSDKFNRYPFECMNLKAVYDYTSANASICSAGSDKENRLILTAKKVGKTEISVYETMVTVNAQTKATTRSRKKIGTFEVTVRESGYTPGYTPAPGTTATPAPGTSSSPAPGTSSTPAPPRPTSNPGGTDITVEQFLEDPVASNLIRSISIELNNKTYTGYASDTGLECLFGEDDEGYSDYIDYGTDLDNIDLNTLNLLTTNDQFRIISVESYGTELSISISLGDEDDTVVDVPIYLNVEEFDTNSIISSINVKLGSASKTIDANTTFFYDDETRQFDEGNKEFEVYFTPKQYEKAGSDEYFDLLYPDADPDDYPEDPKTLADLTNVSCSFTPSGRNPAVMNISQPVTDDNCYWTFEVEFQDGTFEEFSIELKVDDEDY